MASPPVSMAACGYSGRMASSVWGNSARIGGGRRTRPSPGERRGEVATSWSIVTAHCGARPRRASCSRADHGRRRRSPGTGRQAVAATTDVGASWASPRVPTAWSGSPWMRAVRSPDCARASRAFPGPRRVADSGIILGSSARGEVFVIEQPNEDIEVVWITSTKDGRDWQPTLDFAGLVERVGHAGWEAARGRSRWHRVDGLRRPGRPPGQRPLGRPSSHPASASGTSAA